MATRTRTLLVVNKTTVLKDEIIQKYINAVQKQVTNDFGPIWGSYGTIKLVPESNLKRYKDPWVLYFLDEPPKDNKDMDGILGYHIKENVAPAAFVFAKTDLDYNLDPCVTFSHEVLELLADISTTWCSLVDTPDGPTLYSIEVCDAVEGDDEAYTIDGCKVSNFVYPEWFDPTNEGLQYDFKNLCKKPLEIRPGGYMSIFRLGDKEWSNINGPNAKRLEVKKKTRYPLTCTCKLNTNWSKQKEGLKK